MNNAQKLFNEFIDIKNAKERAFWREGEIVYLLARRGGYKELVPPCASKTELNHRLGLPQSTVNFKATLWRTYRVKYDFPISTLERYAANKLYKLSPTLVGKTKGDVERLMRKL